MKTENRKVQLDEKYQQWRGFFLVADTKHLEESSPYLRDVRELVDYVTLLKVHLVNSELWNWNSFFVGGVCSSVASLLIYLLVNH